MTVEDVSTSETARVEGLDGVARVIAERLGGEVGVGWGEAGERAAEDERVARSILK